MLFVKKRGIKLKHIYSQHVSPPLSQELGAIRDNSSLDMYIQFIFIIYPLPFRSPSFLFAICRIRTCTYQHMEAPASKRRRSGGERRMCNIYIRKQIPPSRRSSLELPIILIIKATRVIHLLIRVYLGICVCFCIRIVLDITIVLHIGVILHIRAVVNVSAVLHIC
jgi:hypothetical protein